MIFVIRNLEHEHDYIFMLTVPENTFPFCCISQAESKKHLSNLRETVKENPHGVHSHIPEGDATLQPV